MAMQDSTGRPRFWSDAQSPCTFIERDKQKFVIFDAPNDSNLPHYMDEFHRFNVKTVVRVCDSTYSTDPLKHTGVDVYDWPFPDGDAPPDAIIDRWLSLLRRTFQDEKPGTAVAIHCVAGLGRAPVLVAIALIESGMDPLEAVTHIRSKRRGAINQRQLQFLQGYKRRTKDKKCVIM